MQILAPLSVFRAHPALVWQVAKRDVLGRYRGSTFGLLWALVTPFLVLTVYTIAFGYVMGSRWPHTENSKAGFAMILYVGLIVHGFFAECLTRAPTLVAGNPNYVKRVVFPLDVLPWALVGGALFHALLNVLVFAVVYSVLVGLPPATIVYLPIVLLPLAVLCTGVAWLMACLGVYFRDINHVTGVLAMAMLFLSSAIVPEDAIPIQYRWLIEINPLTFIIDQARNVALWGITPDWLGLGLYLFAATASMYAGFAIFHATRPGFADVL